MGTDNIKPRDNWRFGNYCDYILKDKNTLIDYHIQDALTKTLKMFKYTGLPETIPARELEVILQLYGFAYLLKAEDEKIYAFYGGLGGLPDEYYRPTNFIVSNPYLKFFKTVEVNEEGVLIWNDYAHMGMYPRLRRYAEFMAECDITLRFGLINHRITSILEAVDDNQKEEVERFLNDIEEGAKIGVVTGKGFLQDEDGNLRVNEYRKATGQDIKDVIELQQYVKASFFNEIGLQANYNMKREAINDDEAGMNEEALKPLCDDMKESRQEGFKRYKEQYGNEVKVEFNSSWIARKQLDGVEVKKEEEKTEEVKEITSDEVK